MSAAEGPVDWSLVPKRRLGRRVSHPAGGDGGANQEDAKGTDINVVVAQYKKNGTMPNVWQGDPIYGDFTTPDDLHSAFQLAQAANDRFMQLPADVRSAADNDPVQFLRMYEDDSQRAILEEAGLIVNEGNSPINDTPPSATEVVEAAPEAPPTETS